MVVLKADNVVGHAPRIISAACYVFLGRPESRILCTVTGHRRYSRHLPQGGLEIPCRYTFHGEKFMINKVEMLQVQSRVRNIKVERRVSNSQYPSQTHFAKL